MTGAPGWPDPDEPAYSPPPPTRPPPQDAGPVYPPSPYGAPPPYGPPYGPPYPYGTPPPNPYGTPNPYAYGTPYPAPYLTPYAQGYPQPALVSEPLLGWLLLVAAAVAAIAAVLPWATVFAQSFPGTDGDGVLVIICAIVLATCAVVIGLHNGRLWASITACVLSVLITLIGLIDLADVSNVVRSVEHGFLSGSVSVGAGLWLTVVSGLAAVGLSVAAIVRRRPR